MLEGRLSYQEGLPRGVDPNAKAAKLAHLSIFFILSDIFCSTAVPDPYRKPDSGMGKLAKADQDKAREAEMQNARKSNLHVLRPKYGIKKKKQEIDVGYDTIRLIAGTILAVVIVVGATSIVIGSHWPITVICGSLGLAIAAALGFRPTILNMFRGE